MFGFDGSWQKCGCTFNNVVVTSVAVENGKCIDFQIEAKICRFQHGSSINAPHPEEYVEFH